MWFPFKKGKRNILYPVKVLLHYERKYIVTCCKLLNFSSETHQFQPVKRLTSTEMLLMPAWSYELLQAPHFKLLNKLNALRITTNFCCRVNHVNNKIRTGYNRFKKSLVFSVYGRYTVRFSTFPGKNDILYVNNSLVNSNF